MHTPKPRPKPRVVMATPDRHAPTSSPAQFQTPSPRKATNAATPVRYLDIRVAVPVDCPPHQVADYLAKNAAASTAAAAVASPLTVASYESPRRSESPYGFIPISNVASPMVNHHHRGILSPFSPSSTLSKGTVETAESTLATAVRMASPGLMASLAPPLYQSSPTSSRAKSPRVKSPFLGVTTEEDDSVKKTRLKTELCMHYANGRPCPFGVNCTYAHGEEELQMTKLLDMHQAGLIDVGTYRTRPCWTFVATGSCPFGKRCASIHDPRIEGAFPSWLTHTETQGNNSATDINVDALHQKMQNEIHCGTPFGDQFLPESDTWNELYKRVGNIFYIGNNKGNSNNKGKNSSNHGNNNKAWVDNSSRPNQCIPATVKLQIALFMRGDADFSFKYCPQHIIHGELCMVLQKRPFRIVGNGAKQRVTGISHRQYNPKSAKDIMVHELAFGPDADSTARPIALWFNLDPKEIVECTALQAKRYRYKRGLKNAPENKRRSRFDHLDHFQMIRPHEKDAFDLATDILQNRLAMLHAERVVNLKERSEQIARVRHQKEELHTRFDKLLRFWLEFGWPVNKGRAKVTKKTPVPPVDGKYELPLDSLDRVDADAAWTACELEGDENIVMGRYTDCLWVSFTQCEFIGINQDPHSPSKDIPLRRRLPVFTKLAEGREIALERRLPHIYRDSPYYGKESRGAPDRQPERCWKALLLQPEQIFFENEWDIVRDHFDNSRSKKVLSIIQQK